MSYHWLTHVRTNPTLPGFPRVLNVAHEIRDDETYHYEGRNRQRETHGLFQYTLTGEACIRMRGIEHRVPAEHGFLCEIRDPEMAYYRPEHATVPYEFLYTCFSQCLVPFVHELTGRYGPVFEIAITNPAIQQMMTFSNPSPEAGFRDMTASASSAWIMQLLNALAASREPQRTPGANTRLVQQALDWIHANLSRPMQVGDVARALDVSREHLSRVFKQEMAISVYDAIRRQKMLHACHLLLQTPLRIKEVARLSGFDELAHFSRTFKDVLRMTPTALRRRGVMPTFE